MAFLKGDHHPLSWKAVSWIRNRDLNGASSGKSLLRKQTRIKRFKRRDGTLVKLRKHDNKEIRNFNCASHPPRPAPPPRRAELLIRAHRRPTRSARYHPSPHKRGRLPCPSPPQLRSSLSAVSARSPAKQSTACQAYNNKIPPPAMLLNCSISSSAMKARRQARKRTATPHRE